MRIGTSFKKLAIVQRELRPSAVGNLGIPAEEEQYTPACTQMSFCSFHSL